MSQQEYGLLTDAFHAELIQACQGVQGWGHEVFAMMQHGAPGVWAAAVAAVDSQQWDQPKLPENDIDAFMAAWHGGNGRLLTAALLQNRGPLLIHCMYVC